MDTVVDLKPVKDLWKSVIIQAVLDFTKSKITIHWFSKNNSDFMQVCEFAELEPDLIIRGINKIHKNKVIK